MYVCIQSGGVFQGEYPILTIIKKIQKKSSKKRLRSNDLFLSARQELTGIITLDIRTVMIHTSLQQWGERNACKTQVLPTCKCL